MTKNYFNAKKVLMSTLAAAVFSFVFATSANASNPNDVKINGTEIRQYPENNDPQDPPNCLWCSSIVTRLFFKTKRPGIPGRFFFYTILNDKHKIC